MAVPRLVLAFVASTLSLALSLGGIELALRGQSPSLPSLAALDGMGPEERELFEQVTTAPGGTPGCRPDRPSRDRATVTKIRPDGTQASGRPGSGDLELMVVGDSLVQGFGVTELAAWPLRLGARLASSLDRITAVYQVGRNGAEFCAWVRDAHASLDLGLKPDAAVVQVFANDLEVRGMVRMGEQVVALPGFGTQGPVRYLSSRSYLVNQLWFTWATRWSPGEPLYLEDTLAKSLFIEAVGGLGRRLEAEGIPWTTALVAPAGVHLCPEGPRLATGCGRLSADLEAMAIWLEDAGLPVIDLREAWADRPSDLLEGERSAAEVFGEVPVHPGPDGHFRLARAAWPWLEAQALSAATPSAKAPFPREHPP